VQQYVRIASAASPSKGGNLAERELVLLRGPPGLGKSTFATKELSQVQTAANFTSQLAVCLVHICSTDDFFTSISEAGAEQYHFEPKKICQLDMKTRPKKAKKYTYEKQCKEEPRQICDEVEKKAMKTECELQERMSCSYLPVEQCNTEDKEYCHKVEKVVLEEVCDMKFDTRYL